MGLPFLPRKETQLRILREPTVKEMTGLSSTTRWRLERKGEFPRRVRLSAGAMGWVEDEILDWLSNRGRGMGAAPGRATAI